MSIISMMLLDVNPNQLGPYTINHNYYVNIHLLPTESLSMVKKIAIALIHGVGTHPDQNVTRNNPSEFEPTGNPMVDKIKGQIEKIKIPLEEKKKELEKRVKEKLPPHGMDGAVTVLQEKFKAMNKNTELVIKPCVWGSEMQPMEGRLWDIMKKEDLSLGVVRKFMIDFLSEILAYQPFADTGSTYNHIHEIVRKGLKELSETAGPNAPLCVISHSLGSVIAANYFWDLQKHPRSNGTPLEKGETLQFLYTMGSPLALFSMRFKSKSVDSTGKTVDIPFGEPIKVPVWKNFYDPNDIIAYPLKNLNESYQKSTIQDIPVNVGNILTSWNPMSHIEYWTDPKVIDIILQDLKTSKF